MKQYKETYKALEKLNNGFRILPRSRVEKLVINFVEENKIYAEYCKDSEGIFAVNFLVEEESEQ